MEAPGTGRAADLQVTGDALAVGKVPVASACIIRGSGLMPPLSCFSLNLLLYGSCNVIKITFCCILHPGTSKPSTDMNIYRQEPGMPVEKYYPNFTDEGLKIGWLSDLAEVTSYLLSGGAMAWVRSQESTPSPWQDRRMPFV